MKSLRLFLLVCLMPTVALAARIVSVQLSYDDGTTETYATWEAAAASTQPAPPDRIPDYVTSAGWPLFFNAAGAVRDWNFGDSAGRFNELTGYNAAHVYDKPGDYTVADGIGTKLVRVLPYNPPIVNVPAGANLADVTARLTVPWTKLVLVPGATYTLNRTPFYKVSAYLFGSGGTKLRLVGGTKVYSAFVTNGASVIVQGVEIDSDRPLASFPGKVDYHGAFVDRGNLTFRNVKGRNLDNFVEGSPASSNVLILDCETTNELRSGFSWVNGTDWAILGCRAAGSRYEHIVRADSPYAKRLNVTGNDFARPVTNSAKEVLALRYVSQAYVKGNTLRYGWVQISQGKAAATLQVDNLVLDGNTFTNGCFVDLKPMCEHTTVLRNLFISTQDARVNALGRLTATVKDNVNQRTAPTAKPFVKRFQDGLGGPWPTIIESNNVVVLKP